MRTVAGRGSELDADALFKLVVDVIDEVHSKADRSINAIAACAFWHSLVGVDREGDPTTPIKTWADNRSGRYAARLRDEFDEAKVHNRTGCHFHSSYWPAKLLRLRAEEKDAWRRTATWLGAGEFVGMRLTGVAGSSISMLSGTGVFDVRRGGWDEELLSFLKIDAERLPRIIEPRPLADKWRGRWPRLAAAVWHPAVADGAANSIGSGAAAPGTAAVMIGTSAAVRVVLDRAPKKIPKGLFCYQVDDRRYLLGGALSDGGGLIERLRHMLRFDLSENAFVREIAKRGPGARGLTLMPFFAGERSTGYSENAVGSINGLTMAHDAVDVMQVAMEAAGFRLAEILERIESVVPAERIIASGGALSASQAWPVVLADIFGRDLELLRENEASMHGAVLLALGTTGKIELSDTAAPRSSKIKFDPEAHAAYRPAFERHRMHYRNIDIKS